MMGIPAAITAGLEAVKAFFGWKTQKEINRPGEQKREEVQQIRKEYYENDKNIDAWVDRGKLPVIPKDKADRGNLK